MYFTGIIIILANLCPVQKDLDIEKTTVEQWKCREWYKHEIGFTTSSNAHRVLLTMQNSIDKGLKKRDPSSLDKCLTSKKCPFKFSFPDGPQTPRQLGLGMKAVPARVTRRLNAKSTTR